DRFAAHDKRILIEALSPGVKPGYLFSSQYQALGIAEEVDRPNKLAPSLTLGCGSWGGNSISENVGPKHLINKKTVAKRAENMLW
ncbi:hypothetical protein MJL48_32405, partial [Salmonella enterica subsp. enterica serovar Kentucky]|nr:hypothetical protein [Salmonella enterica subsp. enterica serovar Kentucky]